MAVDPVNSDSPTQNKYNQQGQGNHQYNATSITINGQTHEASARKIAAWLNAPDPRSNHDTAWRQRHANTGTWLLQCDTYMRWKTEGGHVWLYAQPGAGKTVLCSMVAQDLLESGVGHTAFFYFTFSDDQKQSYEQLLLSLVSQVAHDNALLISLYERNQRPTLTDLEHILVEVSNSLDTVTIIIDALDECPEEARENLFEGLEKLAGCPSIRLFLTSRDYIDIRDGLAPLGVQKLSATPPVVDDDISRWLVEQLAKPSFARFNAKAKETIRCSISGRARGMFRWASLQLEEVRKLKVTRPEVIEAKLTALPASLDGMYEHLLLSLESSYHQPAISLLTWLTYSIQPLTLHELAESMLIDVDGGTVSSNERGNFLDPMSILTGLVTVVADAADDFPRIREESPSDEEDQPISEFTRIRLAHFSVQEYLESTRIRRSAAQHFALTRSDGHSRLMYNCLVYLTCYARSSLMLADREDLVTFPLLRYAAQSWYRHAKLRDSQEASREVGFLSCTTTLTAWLHVHQPDEIWIAPFDMTEGTPDGLYLASCLGLDNALQELLAYRPDVNTSSGIWSNPLHAAIHSGRKCTVQLLIDAGADVNGRGGPYDLPLQTAAALAGSSVVRMLLHAGADVNAHGGYYGTALQAAAARADVEIVQLLLDAGADVNSQGGEYGTALQAVAAEDHLWRPVEYCVKIVQTLLEAGADINAQSGYHGTALRAAAATSFAALGYESSVEIVRTLLNAGACVDAQGNEHGTALQAAVRASAIDKVRLLLDAGADANIGHDELTPLADAVQQGNSDTARLLLQAGADINSWTKRGTALHIAKDSILARNEDGLKFIDELLVHGAADVAGLEAVSDSRSISDSSSVSDCHSNPDSSSELG